MIQEEKDELVLYECKKCNYKSFIKCNYDKHCSTIKHKNNTDTKETKIYKQCDVCKKNYKSRNGYWKHIKKCHPNKAEYVSENKEYKDLILTLIKDNKDFKTTIIDVCKNSNTTILQNNTTNNTFNLNIFLNDKCKNAMNIQDFIESIQFQLEDVMHVGKVGYVNGITEIISTNLNKLDITQRPLHCSDSKRETIYIKDNDIWEKDNEQRERLRKVVKEISMNNSRSVYLFREKYPDCLQYESRYRDKYDNIVIEALGGINKDIAPNQNKIMRNITKQVVIDKYNYR